MTNTPAAQANQDNAALNSIIAYTFFSNGIPVGHHEADLIVKDNPVSKAIIENLGLGKYYSYSPGHIEVPFILGSRKIKNSPTFAFISQMDHAHAPPGSSSGAWEPITAIKEKYPNIAGEGFNGAQFANFVSEVRSSTLQAGASATHHLERDLLSAAMLLVAIADGKTDAIDENIKKQDSPAALLFTSKSTADLLKQARETVGEILREFQPEEILTYAASPPVPVISPPAPAVSPEPADKPKSAPAPRPAY